MIPNEKNQTQRNLFLSFSDTLDQNPSLYISTNKVQWEVFEKAFSTLYSARIGRHKESIRLMVGLLILKHIRNLSDEMVVKQWNYNNYFQQFAGDNYLISCFQCEALESVHYFSK
jgi:IS5 family transposase